MNLARADLLPLVLLLPAALLVLLLGAVRRQRRVAALLGEPGTLARLGGARLLHFPAGRLVLLTLAAAALGMAATGPRWGRRVASGESEALNLVLALDVSKSMLARDVAPSRLERERLLVRRLLRELPADRFGLVAFAGRAYVLAPITIDHSAVELYLDALDPGIVSQGGSSLQSALLQATDLARGVEGAAGDRAIVLLTDGEALEDRDGVLQAATRAASAGVRVFAVGIGTAAGAPVPELDPGTGATVGLKRDETGAQVQSRLDEDLLREIAERTDGAYLHVLDGDVVARLSGAAGRLERGAAGNEQRTEPIERFQWFLLLALLLLAADTVLARRAGGSAPVLSRRARAAALLLALLLTGFGIGDLERGNRLYRAGRYAEAAAAYREALESRNTPELHYNLGTALLQLGQLEAAEREFKQALATVEPELRARTLYNLGNRFLVEGRRGGEAQEARLQAAIEAYQQALRIDPSDAPAKWNLELALRERERQQQQQQNQQTQEQQSEAEPQQGGGGSGAEQQPTGEGAESGQAQQQRPMSQEEADRILSAAEQDERDLAREKLRQGQRRSPVIRDW